VVFRRERAKTRPCTRADWPGSSSTVTRPISITPQNFGVVRWVCPWPHASGKLLSVAAYPPPTIMHPHSDVHWGERFYREVAQRCDQVVPMLYDTGIFLRQPYRGLVRDWTREVLSWARGTPVLLGLPAYDDRGVGYHDPDVENLAESLAGVHAGLAAPGELPEHYDGVAIYSEWTMREADWHVLRTQYLRQGG